MDFYEICIFPIEKTIERQYMATYGFDAVQCPISKHYEIHIWPIDVPISDPYMGHVCPISLSLVRVFTISFMNKQFLLLRIPGSSAL